MRLVQVLVPEGKSEDVLEALDGQGIDYALFEERGRGEFEAMVQFPVPPEGVEEILDSIYAAGIREDAYTIVLPTETVVSSRLAMLSERFGGTRISREELLARARDASPVNSTFFAFLVLSTVIATAGLLLNSAATIIGAMVVAPLMGPAISASVGTVLNRQELVRRGVFLQVAGLIAAIATGALFGLVVQGTQLIPPNLDIREVAQIAERTSPNFLSLFLALGSGIAGAISIMRNAGSALVGVAIAVALVPPAATSGLGIAWGLPGVALAGAVLVVVNLLAINLTAMLLFYFAGYRPEEAGRGEGAGATTRRAVRSRAAFLVGALAALSVVLGLVTLTSFQAAAYEADVNRAAQSFVDQLPADQRVSFERAEVDYRPADILLGERPRVDVYIGVRFGDTIPEDFADRMDAHLTEQTGREVVTRVGVIEGQTATEDQGVTARLPRPNTLVAV
ncbi:TIGR00341 family protein [Salinirubellus salinus]|uniref:TIGR00341 family protein n=1 Tax=Salinirubellus salinus TaxID=1364945 RepID=A0A9E7R2S9_9EURY|nr:TIGR00341 family protein [Salinirubellus salinus]UWM53753.1 TIGR00341 family protein [Salinirubellus salinus]